MKLYSWSKIGLYMTVMECLIREMVTKLRK
jgi:hypothetical protein